MPKTIQKNDTPFATPPLLPTISMKEGQKKAIVSPKPSISTTAEKKISPTPQPVPSSTPTKIHVATPIKKEVPISIKFYNLIEKIKGIAIFILKIGVSGLLYWFNPSLFAIGLVAGIIMDQHAKHAIQDIKDIWKSRKVAVTIVGGIGYALSIPVTLALAAIFWSANFGADLKIQARKILKKHPSEGGTTQKLHEV